MVQTVDSSTVGMRLMCACRFLVALGVAWIALGLVFPEVIPNAQYPIAVLVFDLLLVWLAANDLRTRHVPNTLTYPIMAAGVVRAVWVGDPTLMIFWCVLYLMWAAHIFGGGDAKVLMGLFGLFPDMRMAWVVSLSVLATGIPYLAYKHRRTITSLQALNTAARSFGWHIITLQFLPSQRQLDEEGVPFVLAFSLAGAVYLALRGWQP